MERSVSATVEPMTQRVIVLSVLRSTRVQAIRPYSADSTESAELLQSRRLLLRDRNRDHPPHHAVRLGRGCGYEEAPHRALRVEAALDAHPRQFRLGREQHEVFRGGSAAVEDAGDAEA